MDQGQGRGKYAENVGENYKRMLKEFAAAGVLLRPAQIMNGGTMPHSQRFPTVGLSKREGHAIAGSNQFGDGKGTTADGRHDWQ